MCPALVVCGDPGAVLGPALWCLVAALGLMLVHLLVSDRPLGWLGAVPVAAWVVVPATVGYGLRLRHDAAERLRAEIIRQRVDDERLRVAQYVFDAPRHAGRRARSTAPRPRTHIWIVPPR